MTVYDIQLLCFIRFNNVCNEVTERSVLDLNINHNVFVTPAKSLDVCRCPYCLPDCELCHILSSIDKLLRDSDSPDFPFSRFLVEVSHGIRGELCVRLAATTTNDSQCLFVIDECYIVESHSFSFYLCSVHTFVFHCLPCRLRLLAGNIVRKQLFKFPLLVFDCCACGLETANLILRFTVIV